MCYAAKKSLVVYTAISGKYDILRFAPIALKGVDFVCFSDSVSHREAKRKGWELRSFPEEPFGSVIKARYVKINPHHLFEEYWFSLWVDSNIQVFDFVSSLLIDLLGRGEKIAAFPHPDRDCIYREAEACKKIGKDAQVVIEGQTEFLKHEGYPEKNGLNETGVLFRKHSDSSVQKAMDVWYNTLFHLSKRDQLSFNYALWKKGVGIYFLKGDVHGHSHCFLRGRHRGSGILTFVAFLDACIYRSRLCRIVRAGVRLFEEPCRWLRDLRSI